MVGLSQMIYPNSPFIPCYRLLDGLGRQHIAVCMKRYCGCEEYRIKLCQLKSRGNWICGECSEYQDKGKEE